MLSSILLYLEDEVRSESVIRVGVRLAKDARARVRGLTLVDTRMSEEVWSGESAVYATLANSGRVLAEQQQHRARMDLSHACLKAGTNFDIRSYAGHPMDLLGREARYHDLVVTAGFVGEGQPGLTATDLFGLVERGVQPLLVLHPDQQALQRVLLVYDGSDVSGRAIRSYLSLDILAEAECRLLAIGDNEQAARGALSEMADYCNMHCPGLETGIVVGNIRRWLVPYINKWQADLVVHGTAPTNWLYRKFVARSPLDVLQQSTCALFGAT